MYVADSSDDEDRAGPSRKKGCSHLNAPSSEDESCDEKEDVQEEVRPVFEDIVKEEDTYEGGDDGKEEF